MIASTTFDLCRGVFQHAEMIQRGVGPEKLREDFAPAVDDADPAIDEPVPELSP
jgi:hypothetical protein